MGCVFLALALYLASPAAMAMDWIMFFGSEPDRLQRDGRQVENRDTTPHLLGFVQSQYVRNQSTPLETAGLNRTSFAYVFPDLERRSKADVSRAKLGARGMLDADNRFNYFLLTEFGHNGLTEPLGHEEDPVHLTDASLSLRLTPGVRLKLGRFYAPIADEAHDVLISPYASYTSFTQTQIQESFVWTAAAASVGGVSLRTGLPAAPSAAFHDSGVQVFDALPWGENASLTYALMWGQGSGVSGWHGGNSDEAFLYLAHERYLGQRLPWFTESFKVFGWGQTGTRHVDGDRDYRRTRYGVGANWRQDRLRLGGEYMRARGMVQSGIVDTDATPNVQNWALQFAPSGGNTASGGYLDAGWRVLPQLELCVRYDWMDLLPDSAALHKEFDNWTFGASYRIKGPVRVDLNYVLKQAKAPDSPAAQTVLDRLGNEVSLRLTYFISL
ncbi:MAG: hypothetical protein B7Y41_08740 [Hydrogenophilales bacterium 28-61-23]|nr:MAG: hypothetical protein B7Y41_08740 [Hydrogenophilales bacterium 28-61-23]